MIPILCYFLICLVLAMIDWKTSTIPLCITVPAVVTGFLLTGNVLPAFIMYAIGAVMFKLKMHCGGDTMLMVIAGMFLG